MGWWLQLTGLILAVISGAGALTSIVPLRIGFVLTFMGAVFSLMGFVISPQQTIINSIRLLFSETQSIKFLPTALGGNDTINLDNIATLKLYVPSSIDRVTLLLDVVPIALPDKQTDFFKVEDAQSYNQTTGVTYVFDTNKNRRHEITLKNRTFIVTLQKIRKLKVENIPGALEYQFGISEKS